jgi:hypothetical protein
MIIGFYSGFYFMTMVILPLNYIVKVLDYNVSTLTLENLSRGPNSWSLIEVLSINVVFYVAY